MVQGYQWCRVVKGNQWCRVISGVLQGNQCYSGSGCRVISGAG